MNRLEKSTLSRAQPHNSTMLTNEDNPQPQLPAFSATVGVFKGLPTISALGPPTSTSSPFELLPSIIPIPI